ncbi:MAG: hypothetical protein K7J15_06225, partial [Candidatus Regiella insecticola]|nr:hypothetical protein [Candidatus Regiella insecticola]
TYSCWIISQFCALASPARLNSFYYWCRIDRGIAMDACALRYPTPLAPIRNLLFWLIRCQKKAKMRIYVI